MEYQDEFDINTYDFGARNYDPALGRWMSVDPLAEEFFSWNPYHYVHNNPLRFIDPTGMSADDIIDIDKKTGAITITEAAGEDIVRLINNDKVEDSYSYGSNGSFSSDNIIDRNGSDITLTSVQIIPGSIDKAQAFYEFAAQSDVEFGKLDVRSPSGESISIVTTSGETTAVSTLPKLVTDYSKRGFTGVKQSHSHPGTITSYNESVPSGHYDYISGNPSSLMPYLENGEKVHDALNAIQVRNSKGFSNTKFEVYAPGNNTTTTYDGINKAKINKN